MFGEGTHVLGVKGLWYIDWKVHSHTDRVPIMNPLAQAAIGDKHDKSQAGGAIRRWSYWFRLLRNRFLMTTLVASITEMFGTSESIEHE